MPIRPHISPRIVGSVASLYNDTNRIFMEYIDNAIDSADQHWLVDGSKSYSRPVEISVVFSGKTARDAEVTITDNRYGITHLQK